MYTVGEMDKPMSTAEKLAMGLPTSVLLAEADRRRKLARKCGGPGAIRMKFRKCRGCGGTFNTRQLRSHPCSLPLQSKKRYGCVVHVGPSWFDDQKKAV